MCGWPCIVVQCWIRNQLDVTYIYFSYISCSTSFGPPCAHPQELMSCATYSPMDTQPANPIWPPTQPRHYTTSGKNTTKSSAPEDGHKVAQNMLNNLQRRNKYNTKWHLVGFLFNIQLFFIHFRRQTLHKAPVSLHTSAIRISGDGWDGQCTYSHSWHVHWNTFFTCGYNIF